MNNNFFLLTVLLCFFSTATGASNNKESAFRGPSTASITGHELKVVKLDSIPNLNVNLSHDSTDLILALSQLDAVQNTKNKGLQLGVTMRVAEVYAQTQNYNKAHQYYYKALSWVENKQKKGEIYLQLAFVSGMDNKFTQAHGYLTVANQLGNADDLHFFYNYYKIKGLCYFNNYQFALAQKNWEQAQELALKLENKPYLTELYHYQGQAFYKQNNFALAAKYFNEAINLYSGKTLSTNYARLINNTGIIYQVQNLHKDALKAFSTALNINLKVGHKNGVAESLLLLGKSYQNLGESEQARKAYSGALDFFQSCKNKSGLIKGHLHMAHLLLNEETLPLAKKEARLAYRKSKASGLNLFVAKAEGLLGKVFLLENDADSANHYLKRAILHYKPYGKDDNLARAYALLSEVAALKGDFKEALKTHKQATQISDSLKMLINANQLNQLQAEYKWKEQASLIQHLQSENEESTQNLAQKEEVLEKQSAYFVIVLVLLGLIAALALLLSLWYHQKRKAHDTLLINKHKIEQHREEIEAQKQHLTEVNQELEKLSIVARETDNGVKIMNAVGRVLWINEGYTRLHGYKLDDLQLVDSLSLIGENANINLKELVNVWYGDKKPITFESQVKTKAGKSLWVQTTLTPLLDAEGQLEKMIAIDTNITRSKNVESELRVKNKDITSSIAYAKKIQEAMMPPFDLLQKCYPDSFYFHKPKSIVSGDFYWMTQKNDRLVVVCADSTGHGVPGAFMSMIGMSFLNKIVNEKGFTNPATILNRLRMNIVSHLHQKNRSTHADDGMDASVISIDTKYRMLEYSGAMNSIYILRAGDIIELKPDRMPAGFYDNEDRPFSTTTFSLEAGDQVYMFTDGYYDQFGGSKGSKMKTYRFKEILKQCHSKSALEQHLLLENHLQQWQGQHEQVDDILVMGIGVQ